LLPEAFKILVLETAFVIFPLGDSAATIDLSDQISDVVNRKVLALEQWFLDHPLNGIKDLIVGYSSLSVFYDPVIIRREYSGSSGAFPFIKDKLEEAYQLAMDVQGTQSGPSVRIPVCYDPEFGIDLHYVSTRRNLSVEEIIELHLSRTYRVYMIGFLPGFSYLGQLDERLVIPRKLKPVPVSPGSVGIAGTQTGIYSLHCPGGWQIIGKTPMKLFDPAAVIPVKLKSGDQVCFYRISRDEFDQSLNSS
jgi:inhibitor of KinA